MHTTSAISTAIGCPYLYHNYDKRIPNARRFHLPATIRFTIGQTMIQSASIELKHLSVYAVFIFACLIASPAWSQTVIFENDFDDDATGQYSIANLDADWNSPPFDTGVEEGRVSIIGDSNAFSGKSLEVSYPQGQHRSANSGAQWQLLFDQGYEEMYVEYRVKFGAGFDFVRGGKLPGLIGGEANTGGDRPDGTDGFSARMHWRTDGSSGSPLTSNKANITQYLYHPDQPNTYAEDFRWDDGTNGEWAIFESDQWYHIRHRVVMNSVVNGVAQYDGIVQAWLDGQLVLDLNNIRFRYVDTLQIDGFYFSTFFGGSGSQWNASDDEVAFFDDFKIFTGFMPGDINQSGAVDFLDISPFIGLLSSGGFQVEADLNEDNAVDFLDISPFIAVLSN
jgi:hypothetical protein